jgi:hypothetical protein
MERYRILRKASANRDIARTIAPHWPRVGTSVAPPPATPIPKSCVASGGVPLVAVTVPEKVPAVVGVPLIAPAELKVNPGGKPPAVKEKVGEPVDVYVKS